MSCSRRRSLTSLRFLFRVITGCNPKHTPCSRGINERWHEGNINLRDSVIPPPPAISKSENRARPLINERDYISTEGPSPAFLEHTRPIARAARVGGGKYYPPCAGSPTIKRNTTKALAPPERNLTRWHYNEFPSSWKLAFSLGKWRMPPGNKSMWQFVGISCHDRELSWQKWPREWVLSSWVKGKSVVTTCGKLIILYACLEITIKSVVCKNCRPFLNSLW